MGREESGWALECGWGGGVVGVRSFASRSFILQPFIMYRQLFSENEE